MYLASESTKELWSSTGPRAHMGN